MQPGVVDKARLFLKPDDFVDGLLGLSLASSSSKHQRDVIRMSFLSKHEQPMTCLRCDGETEIKGTLPLSNARNQRWIAWERNWLSHCVCGGLWAFNPIPRI
jgi:hypothetical protein